eukprot:TRINITY_DN49523_c0_g1_i1.p1 TRINITY_DN49523_c0_g1~~TRINITY_DN49523_c0_g1_i1.p1  ORF type:complete len:370 (-),score=48.51 TRINITY_DN49523_c0_g1_i1:62-1171(-)
MAFSALFLVMLTWTWQLCVVMMAHSAAAVSTSCDPSKGGGLLPALLEDEVYNDQCNGGLHLLQRRSWTTSGEAGVCRAKTCPHLPLGGGDELVKSCEKAGAGSYSPALCNPMSQEMMAPAPPVVNVSFHTTAGQFVIEIVRAWAPVSADRFYNLARLGYYKDSAFYRVVKNWVVQFGPAAVPSLSKVYANNNCMDAGLPPCHVHGACFYPDEVKVPNKRGYVAISVDSYKNVCGQNKCPCSSTPAFCSGDAHSEDQLIGASEVYINLADNDAALDQLGFSPFGRVVVGMDVVDRLYGGYGEMACAEGMCKTGRSRKTEDCLSGVSPMCASKHDTTVNCSAPPIWDSYMKGTAYLLNEYPRLSFIKDVTT